MPIFAPIAAVAAEAATAATLSAIEYFIAGVTTAILVDRQRQTHKSSSREV